MKTKSLLDPTVDDRNSIEPGDEEETKETKDQEQSDYEHIQEFVDSLDKDELAYLKGCLKNHKISDEGDKEVSSKDFED